MFDTWSAILGALAAAAAGYFLGIRQNNKARQREQQWRIYLDMRVLEEINSDAFAHMPQATYKQMVLKHRGQILHNLAGADLPEMIEILRAINWVGFPNVRAQHLEQRRLAMAVLRRLDPVYCQAIEDLEAEWGPLQEGPVPGTGIEE